MWVSEIVWTSTVSLRPKATSLVADAASSRAGSTRNAIGLEVAYD